MPGKKLYSWGPDGDANVKRRLTQNFPSYIEIQSGTTPNQETRLWLDPQQASHFTEYWMPVRGLDGVSRASLAGVLYLGRTTSSPPTLVAEFDANAPMAGVTVKILDLENTVFTETVNLDPATTYVRSVANPATGVNYTFQIVDPAKGVLFTHTENTLNALEANKITLGSQPQPDLSKSDLDQEVLGTWPQLRAVHAIRLGREHVSRGIVAVPKEYCIASRPQAGWRFLRRDSKTRLANSPKCRAMPKRNTISGWHTRGLGRIRRPQRCGPAFRCLRSLV
jgi:hypothetical protein